LKAVEPPRGSIRDQFCPAVASDRRKHEAIGVACVAATRGGSALRTLLNIIWLVLSGIWLAIGYAIAGLVMFILIITIPFGIQAFKLAGYSLWPFGRTVVKKASAGAGSLIGNILWLLLAGWWLALAHIVTAFLLAITIIGIPLALGNLKLVPIALWPFGREIVPTAEVDAALAQYREGQRPAFAPPVQLPAEAEAPDALPAGREQGGGPPPQRT
jgi:uncharacterized membrane protein YccF (DUF307 family)